MTTLAAYRASGKVHALLRPEGGAMLLFRPWHITLDGYRVRAVPGAVTPLATPDGEWTHQIALDTRHGPRVLRLTAEAAEVATLAIERWTVGAEKRKEHARRNRAMYRQSTAAPLACTDMRTHDQGAGETDSRREEG